MDPMIPSVCDLGGLVGCWRGKMPLATNRGSLLILKVSIRLTNVRYGRTDEIIALLPF